MPPAVSWPCKVWPSLSIISAMQHLHSSLLPTLQVWSLCSLKHSSPKHNGPLELKPLCWAFPEWPLLNRAISVVSSSSAALQEIARLFYLALRLGWWTSSFLQITCKQFLSHILIENPCSFQLLASGNVALTLPLPCGQWLMCWSPLDSLRAFRLGSHQPLAGATSMFPLMMSDTYTVNYLVLLLHGPSSLPQS